MTLLDDRPIASGITRRPQPGPALPGHDARDNVFSGDVNGSRQVTLTVRGTPRGLRPWWVDYVEQELTHLLRLPTGWDGRRALPLEPRAVEAMVAVLSRLMDESSALPQLFPLVDGGLQAEWHVGGNHIEIEVDGAGEPHVLATTVEGETIAEGVLEPTHDRQLLDAARTFLQRLSARVAAIR